MVPPKFSKQNRTKRRVSGLSFLFGAFLTINSLFCTFQGHGQTCSVRLQVSAIPARCQADGEIHCSLSDTNGSNLSQIRYTYIPESGADSVVETSRSSIGHLRPGSYTVRVQALCATGLSQEQAFCIVKDSISGVTVESEYRHPVNGILYNLYNRSQPYGIVPSLSCQPTGKVQLLIQEGTFPYIVDIWRIEAGDTLLYRQMVFEERQHHGNDALSHDYRDYYTIDSLYAGAYRFLCHDGCGYYMPALTAEVPGVKHNLRNHQYLLRNSSGDRHSYNIITLKQLINENISTGYNDDYYQLTEPAVFEYRFINPTPSYGRDTTAWYDLPATCSGGVFIRDTVSNAACYSDVWFQSVTLQVRPKFCSDTSLSLTFTLYPQGGASAQFVDEMATRLVHGEYYDLCAKHSTLHELYLKERRLFNNRQIEAHLVMPADSLNHPDERAYTLVDPGSAIYDSQSGMQYHSYITLPAHWRVVNASTDSVLISEMISESYTWHFETSLLSVRNGDTLIMEVTDAKGCPIFAKMMVFKAQNNNSTSLGGGVFPYKWATRTQDYREYCPDGRYGVGVMQQFGLYGLASFGGGERQVTYQNVTIRLMESPLSNFYNFTAHTDSLGSLSVLRDSPDNHADITLTYRRENNTLYPFLLMSEKGLPNGRYIWEITQSCDGKRDTLVLDFLHESPIVTELPAYQFELQCSRLNIRPTMGQFTWKGAPMTTYFQVFTNDSIIHSTNAVQKGGQMSIGVGGDYHLCMYALPLGTDSLLYKNSCFRLDTLIHWDGATLDFKHLYSYVCNSHDSTGFVIACAKGGQEPYQYRLYAEADGEGILLESNHTGRFLSVPLRFLQELSIDMEDACHAHFLTNFKISNMENIRKCWVEDGLSTPLYEVGDTCHLHGLAQEGLLYHWRGPAGFEDSLRDVEILLTLTEAGIYHIEIEGSGCGTLRDSIRIEVADPWVNIPCPDAVDFDGNSYPAVRIDHYCWTQRNLESQHYADGRDVAGVLGYVSDIFPDTNANVSTFGRLYRWSDAMDTLRGDTLTQGGHRQGVCPDGWFLPDQDHFEALAQHGSSALRAPVLWLDGGGDNQTQFSALPAGFYNGIRRRCENLLGETRFWSTFGDENSRQRSCFTLSPPCDVLKEILSDDGFGYSIRCILEE